jgi:anthranilate synthase component 1
MYFRTRTLAGNIDLVDLHENNPERYPYVLASTASGGDNGRYDILFAFPQQQLLLDNEALRTNVDGLPTQAGFLRAFDGWWNRLKVERPNVVQRRDESTLPFTGGWFVYLGYELAGEIEPSLVLPPTPAQYPIAMAVRCPAAIIYDRHNGHTVALAETAQSRLLDELERDFNNLMNEVSARPDAPLLAASHISEGPVQDYLRQVARIKQYIVDGDIFQANLSRPWRLTIDAHISDTAIFRRLAETNPGSFAVLARLPRLSVISSSPERLVSVRGDIIETRPIAGTRPRAEHVDADARLAAELMRHPKERAEHIMLIDLERNDLGRICVPGSIHVDELMTLETYQHVHHIVSNVSGRLRPDVTPADVIRAVFPGGTITGCPKVRCIEILAEMEQQPRGAYTGSIGYINRSGDMDLNILIRTLQRTGEAVSFRAGGGIVADSEPEHELAETRAKAKGLLQVFVEDGIE